MRTEKLFLVIILLNGSILTSFVSNKSIVTGLPSVGHSSNQVGGIIIDIPKDIDNLNPALSTSWYDKYIWRGSFKGLYEIVSNTASPNNWWIQPVLVQHAYSSSDGLNWNITLKSGLVWQNGEPLNATDVVFSYKVNLLEDLALNAYESLSPFFPKNASTTVGDSDYDIYPLNETTVHFRLASYINNPEINIFGIPILPYHIFKDLELTNAAWTTDITNTGTGNTRGVTLSSGTSYEVRGPVGNGPYRYVEKTIIPTYSLEINPNFQATLLNMTTPTIPLIEIEVESSSTRALSVIRWGQSKMIDSHYDFSDIVCAFCQNKSDYTKPVPTLEYSWQEVGYNQFSQIWGMNPGDPFEMYGEGIGPSIVGSESIPQIDRWQNITWISEEQQADVTKNMTWFYTHFTNQDRLMIRQAFDTAIPRTMIINTFLSGQGTTIASWILQQQRGYNSSIQARTYDLIQALNNLSAVFGYKFDAGGSGYNTTNYFTANSIVPITSVNRILWTSLIYQAWSLIGINLIYQTLPTSPFFSRLFPDSLFLGPIGADYYHGGFDIGFIEQNSSLFPNFGSRIHGDAFPQANGKNYYFVNDTMNDDNFGMVDPLNLYQLVNNMTLQQEIASHAIQMFQKWFHDNIPASVIVQPSRMFLISRFLNYFNPFTVWNYQDWWIGDLTRSEYTNEYTPVSTTHHDESWVQGLGLIIILALGLGLILILVFSIVTLTYILRNQIKRLVLIFIRL